MTYLSRCCASQTDLRDLSGERLGAPPSQLADPSRLRRALVEWRCLRDMAPHRLIPQLCGTPIRVPSTAKFVAFVDTCSFLSTANRSQRRLNRRFANSSCSVPIFISSLVCLGPYFLHLYGAVLSTFTFCCPLHASRFDAFTTRGDTRFHLIMEYCPGTDLCTRLNSKPNRRAGASHVFCSCYKINIIQRSWIHICRPILPTSRPQLQPHAL